MEFERLYDNMADRLMNGMTEAYICFLGSRLVEIVGDGKEWPFIDQFLNITPDGMLAHYTIEFTKEIEQDVLEVSIDNDDALFDLINNSKTGEILSTYAEGLVTGYFMEGETSFDN